MIMFIPALAGIGVAASAIGGLFKTGLGIAQMIKSGRMKPQRPEYEVSERIAQNLALRQQQLGGRMAGAAEAEANLRQSTASQLSNIRQSAGSSAQALSMGALSQAQENRGMLNLQGQEAQDYQRRLAGLEGANINMAQEERTAWNWNEKQRYEEEAAAKARTMQAGLQNTYSGIQGIGGMAGQGFAMESMMPGFFGSMIGGLFGGGQQQQQGVAYQTPQVSDQLTTQTDMYAPLMPMPPMMPYGYNTTGLYNAINQYLGGGPMMIPGTNIPMQNRMIQ